MIGASLKAMDWTARGIVALLVGLTLLAITAAVLTTCQGRREVTAAKAGKTLSDARTGAARDASAIRDAADARQSETSDIVKDATDEIRSAPDRSAADRIARSRVCQLSDYRGADCALHRPDPRRVD